MRSTHTVATLQVSAAAFNEIADKLRAAGYDHAFVDGLIDMTGIGIEPAPEVGGLKKRVTAKTTDQRTLRERIKEAHNG